MPLLWRARCPAVLGLLAPLEVESDAEGAGGDDHPFRLCRGDRACARRHLPVEELRPAHKKESHTRVGTISVSAARFPSGPSA